MELNQTEIDELLRKPREEIDKIDVELLELLSRRQGYVKVIWGIKKEKGIPPLQNWRFQNLLRRLVWEGEIKWIRAEFVTAIWTLIHDESIRLEKLSK